MVFIAGAIGGEAGVEAVGVAGGIMWLALRLPAVADIDVEEEVLRGRKVRKRDGAVCDMRGRRN